MTTLKQQNTASIRSKLGLSCSIMALGAFAATAAMAQATPTNSTPAAEAEVVIVTGIRGSLQQSIDIKRKSLAIVDSVSSEALGKFPDSNVAESLQRIPGVSIDRQGGEGRFVTVRGFGPEFNTVLLNGRTFASDNEGRSFSFDLLAAELISGADVYKSSQASLQDGGIGSTINVRTARPFDLGKFTALVSAKGAYESNSESFSPQIFGLVSNVFADETIGATLSVSYQARETRRPYIENRGYIPGSNVGPSAAPLFTNVFAPRNQDVGVEETERERLGINGTVQFRPVENLTLTVDGLYNKFTVDSTARALGSWFEPSEYTAATIDSNRTVTSLTTNGFADLIVTGASRETTTKGFGFNADWDISEAFKVRFDTSWSEASDDSGGKDVFTVIGVPATYTFKEAQGDGFPSVTGFSGRGPTAGQANVLTSFASGRGHYVQRQGNDISETVIEHRLDGEYAIDKSFLTAVKGGFSFTDREKSNQVLASNANLNCLYCGYALVLPASLLRPFALGSFLSGGGSVPTAFPTYDAEAYLAYLTSPAATSAADIAYGRPPGTGAAVVAAANGFTAVAQPQSYNVQEKTTAAYLEAAIGGDIGDMVWSGNLGIRYIRTELTASGQSQRLIDLLPVPGDLTIFNAVFAPGGSLATTKSNSYDYVLPSLNLKFEPNRQFAIRVAASRTLTRPQISLLAPATSLFTFRPASLDGAGGNPDLKPYVSDNLDLSVEWYPTRSISVSFAPFRKKISDFIVQSRLAEVVTIANAGNLAVNGVTITGAKQATFQIRRPRNIETAEVKGVELSATITADTWLDGWMSGFGISANATLVDSDATYAPGSTTEIFALEGLGDSWNLTGFYEYGKVSARLAYNNRDRFLENIVTPGQGGDPVYRREFGQLDMRASYQFTDNLQVFFEGTNLTNAQNVQTGRFDNQVLRISDTGARYALGARYEF